MYMFAVPGSKDSRCLLAVRRHRYLAIRTPERVSKARAAVTEGSVRRWFDGLRHRPIMWVYRSYKTEANATDVFLDPRKVYNSDETFIR